MKRGWLLGLALCGCASVGPGQTGVQEFRDAWFTNVSRDGPHTHAFGSEPRRRKDPKVILVVEFAQGGSHALQATLRPPEGTPRPLEWSIGIAMRGGAWRTTSASWRTDRLAVGLYRVGLNVDGAHVGTYALTIR